MLALAGVEDWSRDQSLATLLGLAIVLGPYLQYRGKVPDLAARMVNILMLQVILYKDYLQYLLSAIQYLISIISNAYPNIDKFLCNISLIDNFY